MRDTDEGWTAGEANQLRVLLGLKPEVFARRLKIHKRTVIRWRDAETDPAIIFWEDLDKLLLEAARKLAPWLAPDQLMQMDRREILKLLSASTSVPRARIDVLWNGVFSQVSNTSLSSLEEISTILASKCNTSPPDTLLGSVTGHLEKASGLLRTGAMKPIQRQRLESIVADSALFAGYLSQQTGKLVQAEAHIELAKKMAHQAGNMTLLAQVFAEEALFNYYSQSPDQANGDARPRVRLLEQAQALATRHAPAIVQTAIDAWLAEDRAAAKDGYGADEAFESAQLAFEKASREGPVGTGFVSSLGIYSVLDEAVLQGYQGTVELLLDRPSAVSTIETSLQFKENLRKRASGLADLAIALIACNRPEQACDCLTEAHAIGRSQGSVVILHHVFSARSLMPPKWNRLRCMRELDERLRAGWITTASSQA